MLQRTVLVLDDDPDFLKRLSERSERRSDFKLVSCDSVDGLKSILGTVHPDCILLDYILGNDVPIERVATDLRSSGYVCPIVLISASDCSEIFGKEVAFRKLLSLGVRLFLKKGQLTYTTDIWLDAISFVIEAERHVAQTAVFADMYFYSSRVLQANADLRGAIESLSIRLDSEDVLMALEQEELFDVLGEVERVKLSAENLARVVEEIGSSRPERTLSELSNAEIFEGLDRVKDSASFDDWFEALSTKTMGADQIAEPTVAKFLRTMNNLDDDAVDQQRKLFLASVFGRLSSHLTNIDKRVVYSSLKAL